MKQQTKTTITSKSAAKQPAARLFEKENIKWMVIGLVVMAIGFILMVGGKSENPNVFDENSVYSMRRITFAPMLIIAGLIIEIYAIMRKPKNADQ